MLGCSEYEVQGVILALSQSFSPHGDLQAKSHSVGHVHGARPTNYLTYNKTDL